MPPGGGGGGGRRSAVAVNGDGSVQPSEAGSVGGHVGNGEHGGGLIEIGDLGQAELRTDLKRQLSRK